MRQIVKKKYMNIVGRMDYFSGPEEDMIQFGLS